MQKKFHNLFFCISVLPALLVMPAFAAVGTFDDLSLALTEGGTIDVSGNINFTNGLNLGTNTIINGAGHTWTEFNTDMPEKTDAVNFYTSSYTMADETNGIFYRPNGTSVTVGSVLYSDADCQTPFGTVTFANSSKKVYSIDSTGTQTALTRASDKDVHSGNYHYLAFDYGEGQTVYAYVYKKNATPTEADITSSTLFYATPEQTELVAFKDFVNNDGDFSITFLEAFTYSDTGKPHDIYVMADGTQVYTTYNNSNVGAFYSDDMLSHKVYIVYNNAVWAPEAKIKGSAGASLTLNNLVIDGFYATDDGAVISDKTADGKYTLNNVVFKNNVAKGGGGAIYVTKKDVEIKGNSLFQGNSINATSSTSRGGAIYIGISGNLLVGDGVSFVDNHADLGAQGGAIGFNGVDITVGAGTKFIQNSSLLANGGAISAYLNGDGTGVIGRANAEQVLFQRNSALLGGAVYVYTTSSDKNFDIINAKFDSNTAAQGGGMNLNVGNNATLYVGVTNSEFIGNSAQHETSGAGGAIYRGAPNQATSSIELTLDNVTFKNNFATLAGGAVFDSDGAKGTVTVNNSKFIGNYAGSEGGALVSDSGLDITGGTFTNNRTTGTEIGINYLDSNEGGGAIFLYDAGIANIKNTTFTSNTSGTWGGAISTRGVSSGAPGAISSLNITGGTFSANSAVYGGAIANSLMNVLDGEDITKYGAKISGATFTGNVATTNGGAIYNVGDLTFVGTNAFSDNTANGVANDIHNIGALTFDTGSVTTMDGGVTGTGTLNVADGATLNLGTASIAQSTITLDGALNAVLRSEDEFVSFDVSDSFGGTGALNLELRGAGTYNVFNDKVFDNEKVVISSSAFDYDWNDDFDTITVTMKSVEDIAADNGLTNEAAQTVANLVNSSSEKLNDLADAMQDRLECGDAASVEQAHAAIHPEKESVVQTVAMYVQNTVANLASNRLMALNIGRNGGDVNVTGGGVWAQGIYNKTKRNDAFRGYTRGVAGGVDMTLNRALTLGAGYSYAHSDISGTARNTEVDSSTIFAYGQYKPTNWFMNAVANYTMSDYSERAVALGTAIDASYDVHSYGGQLMTGYDFAGGITPSVGVRYMHISADEYKNSLGIKNKLADSDYMTAILETKWTYGFKMNKHLMLRPELRYAVKYDVMSDEQTATVLLPGVDSYVMSGNRLSRIAGEFGGGLGIKINGFDLSVNYEIELREGFTSQTGRARVRIEF